MNNKYQIVIRLCSGGCDTAVEEVEASRVYFRDGMYYFYNSEDRNDLDQPVAIYTRENVVKITKLGHDETES